MKICFVADARATSAINWTSYFIQRGHSVHVISTYPSAPGGIPGAELHSVPLAFSRLGHAEKTGAGMPNGQRSAWKRALTGLRAGAFSDLTLSAHLWVTPIELHLHVRAIRDLIRRIAPDLVHAMRIPFEGILAAKALPSNMPLLMSVWGNDFTLCASNNPLIARQTRRAMERADGLHCDCRRDLELASREWGFDSNKPATVLPGGGGLRASLFHPGDADPTLRSELGIPEDASIVFNPRGFRAYVRNDVFFHAIPQVLKHHPNAVFVGAGMRSNPIADKWVSQLGIQASVRLLGSMAHEGMARVFRSASVAVSPSLHDGTPNTLLEAMACGCFPVAGDIEPVREWITDGVNGLLCDPTSPESLAAAIVRALGDETLRKTAQERNARMIAERAERSQVMLQVEEFYFKLVGNRERSVKA